MYENALTIANCLCDIDKSVDVSNSRTTESAHSRSYIASRIQHRISSLESMILVYIICKTSLLNVSCPEIVICNLKETGIKAYMSYGHSLCFFQ